MDCHEARPALFRRLDGEAPGIAEARLDEHVDACPDCARSLAVAGAARDWFAGRDRPTAPEDLTGRVLERVRSTERSRYAILPMLRAAAAAAVLLIVITGSLLVLSPPREAGPASTARAEVDAVERLLSEVAAEHAPAAPLEDVR